MKKIWERLINQARAVRAIVLPRQMPNVMWKPTIVPAVA